MSELTRDIAAVTRQLRTLRTSAVPTATVQALNRTAKTALGEVAKTVSVKAKLPPKVVKKRLFLKKAFYRRSSGLSLADAQALMRIYTKPVNFSALAGKKALEKLAGQRYASRSATGRKRSPKGFISIGNGAYKRQVKRGFVRKLDNGGYVVFQRQGSAAYPFRARTVTFERIAQKVAPDVIRDTISRRLDIEMISALNNQLRRALPQ